MLRFSSLPLTTWVLMLTCIMTGCATLHIEEGQMAYDELRYQDAIHHFGRAVQRNPDAEAYRMLANAHALVNENEEAAAAYAVLASMPEATDDDRIGYASVLFKEGKYVEAERLLNAVSQRDPGNEVAAALRQSAVLAQDDRRDTTAFTLEPIETVGIRSAFAPLRFANTLYFTGAVERPGAKDPYTDLSYTDLYQMPASGGTPQLVPGVNGPYHDGMAAVSPDGSMLIFTRSNHQADKARKLLTDDSDVNNTTLFYARKGLKEWERVVEIGLSEGANMFAHPAWSPDGSRLYFSSDMPGGQGGMDLWHIRRNGTTWEFPPVNMGSKVNSRGDDVFPSLKGNDTLFFASDAQITFGGLDVLFTVRDSVGSWSSPMHLDKPLNSQSDDFALTFNPGGTSGMVSSDRYGYDRLFNFNIVERPLMVQGIVIDSITGAPIPEATISLLDAEDGSDVELNSDLNGAFNLSLPHSKVYRAEALMDTYFARNLEIETPSDPLVRDMTLEIALVPASELPDDDYASSIREGDRFELPEIRWDYDSYVLRDEAKPGLALVADFLQNRSGIEVELRSHCDARGSDRYNQKLSELRAGSAARYLKDLGVAPHQVHPVGVGEGELRNECGNGVPCSEAKHQENRRTEFLIVRTSSSDD